MEPLRNSLWVGLFFIHDNGQSHIFRVEGGFVVRHDAAHLQDGNLKIFLSTHVEHAQVRPPGHWNRSSQLERTTFPHLQNVAFFHLNSAAGSRHKHRPLSISSQRNLRAGSAVGFLSTSPYRRTLPAAPSADFPRSVLPGIVGYKWKMKGL